MQAVDKMYLYLPVDMAIFRDSRSGQKPGFCTQIPTEITDSSTMIEAQNENRSVTACKQKL